MTIYSRLAAYYPCDTTHGRSLSEDAVGTNNATAGVVSSATGKVRQGMFFLSSGSQFRSVPNDSAIQGLLGVCCWVKFSTLSADMAIVSKGSDGTDANTSIKLWYDHSDTDLAFTVGDSSSSTTIRTDGLSLAVDTWYHVRCYNDGNRMGIAVNGILYGSGTARAPLTETGLLYLGNDFSNNYFDGVLDEVALFSTSPTIADGAALYNGGTGATLPLLDTLPGPSGRASSGSRWTHPSFAESNESVVYMAHGKMPVQRFDGTLAPAGVEAPDQKLTIESSGSGVLTGKRYAYLRFLDSEGRVSNVSPLSDVHDTFGSGEAEITGATNSSPIVITSVSHGISSGDTVRVTGQQGNTASNGTWTVTVIDADSFYLDGSVGNGDWTASVSPDMRVTVKQEGSSGTSQVQTLSYTNAPTSGSFTLSFRGDITTSLTHDDTAADIQAALEALPSIGEDNVVCAGGALPTAVTVTFAEALASQDLPLLVVDFTGAVSTIVVTETTKGSTGNNEIQTIDLLNSPTGGTFTATFDGQTTGNIAYNASAATVEAALEALSNITVGDLTTTGGSLPGTPVSVEFGGSLAETNLTELTIDPTNLTGGPSIAISTPTPGVAPVGFDLSSPSYDSKSYNPTEVVGNNRQMRIVNSGTKAHFIGGSGTRICYQYSIGTLDDISTCSYDSISQSFGTTDLVDFVWNPSGSKLFQLYGSACTVKRKTTSNWNIKSMITNYVDYNASAQMTSATGLAFNPGGTKMFICGVSATVYADTVFEYTLSTAETPSTATYVDSLDMSGEITSTGQTFIHFNSDGTELYAANRGTVYQYDLTTGYDLSTGSYSGTSYSASAQVGSGTTMFAFNDSGTKMMVGTNPDVYQYDTGGSAGTNEVQRITVSGSPSEGSFTLSFGGETTDALDHDSTAAEVQTAFTALSTVGSGNATGSGGPLPGSAVDVTYTGALASTDVAAMTADDDGLEWDVSTTPGTKPVDELVTLAPDVPPGKGTWTMTFGGQTTAELAWNATAAQVETKFAALSTVGAGNVDCTGGPIHTSDIKVQFSGTLSKQDVGAITATSSLAQTSPLLQSDITTDGVVPSNEVQTITVSEVTGGTFALTSDADSTGSIRFDATAADVEAELHALSDVGNANAIVTGGPLTEASFSVEFIGTLGGTNISTLGVGAASLLNGGWASGANKITYTDVDLPVSTNITRRQILRTKPGSANVFYIDVDEEDVSSNTFSSTKTDEELTSDLAVVMIDSNGVDTNLSRHGVPPSYKRVVASHQNRLFYGVDYVEGSMVTISGDTATGVATDWPNVFDGRTLYDDTGKALADVDANQQTAALSESTATAQEATRATIRQGGDDSQRVYHSALTAIEALPESVHPNQSFLISRSDRDGDMSGQFVFDGQQYVTFQSAIYRYSYNVDPASAPDGDGRMQLIVPRGTCNNRTVAFTDDLAFCVDREGAYLFDGDTLESVSGPIKPMFSGRGSLRINWKHQDNFHAAYFSTERTVRLFVTLDGGPYPNHALCWNVDQRYWWIEKFAYPIVSSAVGVLDGKNVVFLGSTGRRIFTMTGTREALGRNVPGSLRGTATSSNTLSVSDSAATFSSSLLGSTVTIVSGTGRGQTRRIVEVASTKLTVHEQWGTQPSTDSVYQLAAVNWSIKTGKLRFEQSNEKELRRLEMFWEPLSNSNTLDYQLFMDFKSTAVENERTLTAEDTDGIATTEGTAYNSVDLTERGHVEQDFGGMRQEGVSGNKFLTVEVEGSTNDEQLRLLGIAVSGAE